jgi:hypothetical protein
LYYDRHKGDRSVRVTTAKLKNGGPLVHSVSQHGNLPIPKAHFIQVLDGNEAQNARKEIFVLDQLVLDRLHQFKCIAEVGNGHIDARRSVDLQQCGAL